MAAAPAKTDKNIEIKLRNVRLSYAHLFSPQEFKDDKDPTKIRHSYSGNFLIPKKINDKGEYDPNGVKNPMIKVITDGIKQAIAAQWGENPPQIPQERRCFRDGEPKDPDTVDPDVPGSGTPVAISDGYAGHYFISANRPVERKDSPNPVQLLGPRKTDKDPNTGKPRFPRLKEADGMLYSGCYVDVVLRIYGFDGKKKDVPNRVNASLEAVKFVRHGEAFGSRPIDADSAFDEEDSDDGFGGSAAGEDDDDIG